MAGDAYAGNLSESAQAPLTHFRGSIDRGSIGKLHKRFADYADNEPALAVLDIIGGVFESAWCCIEARHGDDGRPVGYLCDRCIRSPEHGSACSSPFQTNCSGQR